MSASGSVAPLTYNPAIYGPLGVSGGVTGTSSSAQLTVGDPWSIRGRLGFAQPTWMVYGTGGFAETRLDFNGNLACLLRCTVASQAPASFSTSRSGWVAGGGIEFKPVPGPWIVGLEYLYYRFDGTSNISGAFAPPISPATAVVNYSVGAFNLQTVRFRVSYKF